jgi:hypothetical protein
MDIITIKNQLLEEINKIQMNEVDKIFFIGEINNSQVFNNLSYYMDIYNFNENINKLFVLYNYILNNS